MSAPFHNARRHARRRGQVAVFLLMVLTALAFVLLWSVDIHRIITAKTRTQNAGDAAALAGARWQGIGINFVGELNLLHALALSISDKNAVDAITNMQAHVLFTAPLTGFAAAQVAAKNNGMYANDSFTQLVRNHAQEVRHYGDLFGGVPVFSPPYPGAWNDYADMLDALANDGIAAGPDNTCFYNDNSHGIHILLDPNFYNAVFSRSWCWFYIEQTYYNYPSPLSDYTDYNWWAPLPTPSAHPEYGSEFLSLKLKPTTTNLNYFFTNYNDFVAEGNRDGVTMSIFKSAIMTNNETWYIFDSDQWGTWTRMSLTGDNPFAAGPVRPQYDYAGADIIFRVEAQVAQLLPGANNTTNMSDLVWTAGAKPFGAAGPDGTLVPSQYGLVFPCFTDVRLVPVDACSGAANGTFNTGWRQHVDVDLPRYVKTGQLAAGCWYCQQLKTWDNPSRAFQEEGLTWLSSNKYQCVQHGGGGGGGGGGTSHGH